MTFLDMRHWDTDNILLGMAAIVDPQCCGRDTIDIIPENDENNEDDAAVSSKLKHCRFEDCVFLDADEEESDILNRINDAAVSERCVTPWD